MQIIAPRYYKKFRCIAGECKHSCCVGWEIDVDTDTLEIYNNVKGEWGERFKKFISYDGGTPHFITNKDGRCAFLNQNGLCDIITAFGEDGLCQICYDHPRFRNFYSDRVEIGLGLCCEAAADIILNNNEENALEIIEQDVLEETVTDEESSVFLKRERLFEVIQNNEKTLMDIILQLSEEYSVSPFSISLSHMAKKYVSLERLDNIWDEYLSKLEGKDFTFEYVLNKAEEKISKEARNLLCYFVYRYFATESIKDNEQGAVNFALEATCLCSAVALAYYGDLTTENLSEVCRMFSSEVEYSEENIENLLNSDN